MRFRDPELHAMISKALSGEEDRTGGVDRAVSRLNDGTKRPCTHCRNPGPDEPAFILHFRDLSEVRRIEKMRSDFIANASHELRTPLASLGGFIETLAGPARNDATARDRFLAIMQEQAERMSRLIDDLLSLSRLETAFGRSDFAPVDLADVLHHVLSALSPAAQGGGCRDHASDSRGRLRRPTIYGSGAVATNSFRFSPISSKTRFAMALLASGSR
jgi:two-component system phosphate regulon sensor histidine kinase PhoR